MTVKAATAWRTNADLVDACWKLGYVHGRTLDPTYGLGNWWLTGQAAVDSGSVACDLDPEKAGNVRADFRELPFADDSFDTVVFDPPYVSPGGRKTTGLPEFWARYGMGATAKSPELLFEYNSAGFRECIRVAKRGTHVLYKSQDYISSGKLKPVTHWIINDADYYGMEYVDRLEHIGEGRPQPKGRRQVHARRNLSTLLVFRKP